MAIKIGCPSLKLAMKRSGNASTKRTGRLAGVAYEALDRLGEDKDIDRSRSYLNEYDGKCRTAGEFIKEVQRQVEEYSAARQAAGGRAVRDTAGVGFGIVLKPPAEFVNALPDDKRAQFLSDLRESFTESVRGIIADDAILSWVKHRDEQGDHWHVLGVAKTPDGELSADKVVCPALWRQLNKTLPAEMRQRGWDVTDCVNYDPDKAASMTEAEKEQYKAECRAKRPMRGMSSLQYKLTQEKARREALEARIEALEAEKGERQRRSPEGRRGRSMGDIDAATSGLDYGSGAGMSL